ncbi:MAG: hypothetical protein ACM33T_09930 [Solirubrobacterales bacterium]
MELIDALFAILAVPGGIAMSVAEQASPWHFPRMFIANGAFTLSTAFWLSLLYVFSRMR